MMDFHAMEPGQAEASRARLDSLRITLRQHDGAWRQPRPVWPTGLAAIDAMLPGGGLMRGAMHEILAAAADGAAAEGFLATLLAQGSQHKAILWCQHESELYGAALAQAGLVPERIILVRARRPNDLLWAMEEGLRTPGLAAVVGAPSMLDLTASRRLQLAAQDTGVTCFVLGRTDTTRTASVTRWQVTAAPGRLHGSTSLDEFGLMRARWQVRLLRCRGAVPLDDSMGYGTWLVTEGDVRHAAEAVPMTPVQERDTGRDRKFA